MPKKTFQDLKASFQTTAFRAGSYSVLSAVLVIAIAVAVNLAVGKLPAGMTQKDLSADKMFTLSQQSTELAEGLIEPVTIYWIASDPAEDGYLAQLLPLYADRSTNLTVEKIDPVARPTFAAAYTDRTPAQNDLVVVSETRSCYVPYSSLYQYDYESYAETGSYDAKFAGESEITRAIDYVTTSDLSKVYLLTGHGETDLPADFLSGMRALNLETVPLNLLTVDAVPEDADCLLINNPLSDITETERDILLRYIDAGGKLFLLTDCETDSAWENLQTVTMAYGMRIQKGIVIEGDTGRCLANYPYYLFPILADHAITQPITEANYAVLTPFSGAIDTANAVDGVTVTPLLQTSGDAFRKPAGSASTTYEKEAGDTDGPFVLAAAATRGGTGSQMVWCASAMLQQEDANVFSSGANQDFFLNCLAWMCGHESSISIHPKQMDSGLLVIPAGTVSALTLVLCVLLPALVLGTGIYVTVKRRRRT